MNAAAVVGCCALIMCLLVLYVLGTIAAIAWCDRHPRDKTGDGDG